MKNESTHSQKLSTWIQNLLACQVRVTIGDRSLSQCLCDVFRALTKSCCLLIQSSVLTVITWPVLLITSRLLIQSSVLTVITWPVSINHFCHLIDIVMLVWKMSSAVTGFQSNHDIQNLPPRSTCSWQASHSGHWSRPQVCRCSHSEWWIRLCSVLWHQFAQHCLSLWRRTGQRSLRSCKCATHASLMTALLGTRMLENQQWTRPS